MKDTCIRIPADLHERLVAQAAVEDRSQRSVLARALDMYLADGDRAEAFAERKEWLAGKLPITKDRKKKKKTRAA